MILSKTVIEINVIMFVPWDSILFVSYITDLDGELNG